MLSTSLIIRAQALAFQDRELAPCPATLLPFLSLYGILQAQTSCHLSQEGSGAEVGLSNICSPGAKWVHASDDQWVLMGQYDSLQDKDKARLDLQASWGHRAQVDGQSQPLASCSRPLMKATSNYKNEKCAVHRQLTPSNTKHSQSVYVSPWPCNVGSLGSLSQSFLPQGGNSSVFSLRMSRANINPSQRRAVTYDREDKNTMRERRVPSINNGGEIGSHRHKNETGPLFYTIHTHTKSTQNRGGIWP